MSVVMIGAGPAGTRAAEVLVDAGLRPIVIDEASDNGGRIYQYYEVPEHVFDGLRQADSHGGYFQDHIRGHYRYARL